MSVGNGMNFTSNSVPGGSPQVPITANQGVMINPFVPDQVQWGRAFSDITFAEDINTENRAIALDWGDGTQSQLLIYAVGTLKGWELRTLDGTVKMNVQNADPSKAPFDMLSEFYTEASGPKIGMSIKKGPDVLWVGVDLGSQAHTRTVPNGTGTVIIGGYLVFRSTCFQASGIVDTAELWGNASYEGSNGAASTIRINDNPTPFPPEYGSEITFVNPNALGDAMTVTTISGTLPIIINGVSQTSWQTVTFGSTLKLMLCANGLFATSVTGTWV